MNQDLLNKINNLESKIEHMGKQIQQLTKDNNKLKRDLDKKNQKNLKRDLDIKSQKEKNRPFKKRGLFLLTEWCVLQDCNQPECHNCFPVKNCKKHEYCINEGRFEHIAIYSDSNSDSNYD